MLIVDMFLAGRFDTGVNLIFIFLVWGLYTMVRPE